MRIEAESGALTGAGATQTAIAGTIADLSRGLTAAAESGSAGAGDPGVSAAVLAAVQSWQASLAMVGDSVGAIGRNLGAAGVAYADVDESAIPAGDL